MSDSLFRCRTCDTSFASSASWREHAKSDEHVANLRSKVAAASGTTLQSRPQAQDWSQRSSHDASESESDEPSDMEDVPAPEFLPDQCLFCPSRVGTFEDNLGHMASQHSFLIPKSDCLSVDAETLIWYLHLVIFGYFECILCGKQKGSAEGVQHHMVAKAHCRFDIAGDLADFYDLENTPNVADMADTDEQTLTLPNGKVVRHRSQPAEPRRKQPSTDLVLQEKQDGEEGKQALTRSDRTLARLATQISHFRAGDQQSLSHLPASELRSVLLVRKKQISTAKRQERRWASKMEAKNNRILQGHFKPDVPGRING